MNLIRHSNLLDFDRLLNDFWGPRSTLQRVPRNVVDTPLAPRVDVTGHDDRYEFVVELPGFTKDDVTVSVEDGYLTIEASKESDASKASEGRVILRERRSGGYVRKFHVGEDVDSDSVSAKFADGLLNITVPLLVAEEPTRRLVEIS